MSKQPNVEGISPGAGILTVLSVSPHKDDHCQLDAIIGHTRWVLLKANRLEAARSLLQDHEVSVIVCERDLEPGAWTDLLDYSERIENPPALIVTSRLADERLWSEALNRGAWDVLAKPFHRQEVLRSVRLGWEHWHHRQGVSARPVKVMSAAG